MRLVRRKSRSRMTRWPNRVPRMAWGSMTTPSPIERFNRCHRSDDGAAKRAPCKKCLRANWANWRTCVSWARLNRMFRIRKEFVKACSKTSPSASEVFWAGGAGPIQSKISGRSLVAVPLKTIVEIRFKAGIVVVLKRND